jgi:hypothetical protein
MMRVKAITLGDFKLSFGRMSIKMKGNEISFRPILPKIASG